MLSFIDKIRDYFLYKLTPQPNTNNGGQLNLKIDATLDKHSYNKELFPHYINLLNDYFSYYFHYDIVLYCFFPFLVAYSLLELYMSIILNFLTLILQIVQLNNYVYTFKFLTLISLLVFIRGGIPRYRYDFLTKLG